MRLKVEQFLTVVCLILVLLLVVGAVFSNAGKRFFSDRGQYGKGEAVELPFSEEAVVGKETSLEIRHAHGNIVAVGWNRDRIQLEGVKIVRVKDRETAEKIAKGMKVDIRTKKDKLLIETIRPKTERKWGVRQQTVNYELRTPHDLALRLATAQVTPDLKQVIGPS